MSNTQKTGYAAIAYAEANGLTLSKYNDPTEAAREGLSVAEAREIAKEDPSLVYVEMSEAAAIARRYNDDGLSWKDADGVELHDACKGAGATIDEQGGDVRYTFADGSVLTAAEGGWDLGYTDCFCWRGAGHTPECEAGA